MEVIILEDVTKLGKAGDVVKVKAGFARNFLVPNGLAIPCTKSNKKMIEEHRRLVMRRKQKEIGKYEALRDKIAGLSCTINVQVGEEDKMYGSVTNADIQKALANEGIEVDKRKIKLEEPIKSLGIYTIDIELHSDVNANLKVWVVKE
jgi:large subunit ribosomal protein L9